MITVVIPFYQRRSGILAQALASIAAQQDCPLPVTVIVVDDQSPLPARQELVAQPAPAGLNLKVIEQANGGPGAARNAGLDAAPAETRYIAFLDSDDQWSPQHLASACLALDLGHDFYFADHYQLDAEVSAFERARRLDMSLHPAIGPAERRLHHYGGDMLEQIIRGNVVGTSTVVFRRAGREGLRFRPEYKSAGEDYLFWLDLNASGARIAFSREVEATYGHGVNVYSGVEWGSEAHMQRITFELRYRQAVLREFVSAPEQARFIRARIDELRLGFLQDLLHRLRHGKKTAPGLLPAYLRHDPALLWRAPWLLARSRLSKT